MVRRDGGKHNGYNACFLDGKSYGVHVYYENIIIL